MNTDRLGLAGRIAAYFQAAKITPLLALLVLLLGVIAVLVTPREEEPQINVMMANVFVPFPGASVRDVEQMVSTPAEQVLSQISGVEHVLSVSRPGMAVLSVQFKVGVTRIEALVRAEKKLNPNVDFYSASTYYALGIPIDLFTPIFAVSRVSGWTAHVLEQYANNRLIRPRAEYVGPEYPQRYVAVENR